MVLMADQPAQNIFWFSEYLVMPQPTGKKAINLRELLQHLQEMSEPVLEYHLWQSRLTLTQTAVEYTNDFALWAAKALNDPNLAERLSSLDPFEYEEPAQIREALVDMLEEYLWDFPFNPEVRPGFELYFCEASSVIMPSGISAQTLRQFCAAIQTVGLDSVYYHFVEARRRLRDRKLDDFSHWIETNFDMPELVSGMRGIDIFFYTLSEIRDTILSLIKEHVGETCDQPE
ncbi:MAG: DUF5752 family protein [Deltaproteobacteria bacterium]|nr:DUF5752 family protein [Deltaproteobacteria bacterium]